MASIPTVEEPERSGLLTPATEGIHRPHRPGRRARLRKAVALSPLVGGAWLLPLGTHAVGLDVALPAVVLLGVAGLLRSGRTLLDRLVLATTVLVGAVCAAGLLFSIWPWGLHPVPVAQAALLALVAIGVCTGRRPELPTRRLGSDLWVAVAGVVPAVFLWSAFWGRDAAGRLALVIGGEDLARHFTLFDAVRTVNGYLHWNGGERTGLLLSGMDSYPHGSHLLAGLLENFVRSSVEVGDPVTLFDHYIGWCLAGYGLLGLTLVWGARWVAGPALRGWRLVAVAAVIGGFAAGGYLVTLVERGWPSETVGLALLAVLLAVAARPLRRPREQLVVLAASLVGIGFSYYLFLPLAGVAALVSVIGYRTVRRAPVTASLVAAVAGPLACYWPLVGLRSGISVNALLPAVGLPEVDRRFLVVLGGLILLGALTRTGRRGPVWRPVLGHLVAAGLVAAAIGVYQIAHTGGVSYYFEKALHGVLVAALTGIGAVALLLPRDPFGWTGQSDDRPPAPGRALVRLIPAALSVLVALASFGLLAPPRSVTTHQLGYGLAFPAQGVSRGRAFQAGHLARPADATAVIRTVERFPDRRDGTATLVVTAYRLYLPSLFLASYRRQGGEAATAVGMLHGQEELGTLEEIVERSPLPVRFVVSDPEMITGLTALRDRRPELRFALVQVPVEDAPPPGPPKS